MEPFSILAACFGGISALTAVFDLFKKWREGRRQKKSLESDGVQRSFTNIPLVIRSTCESCLRRAGEKFNIGDGKADHRSQGQHLLTMSGIAIARSSISRATTNFTRTLTSVFHLALDGRSLDLVSVRNVLDGFGRDMVLTLGGLFERVSHAPATASEETSLVCYNMQTPTTSVLQVSHYVSSPASQSRLSLATFAPLRAPSFSDLKTSADFPSIRVPALGPLRSTTQTLKATLDALNNDRPIVEFSTCLSADLDAIQAARPAEYAQPMRSVQTLESWDILRRIQDEAAIGGGAW